MKSILNGYVLTQDDIEAINRLVQIGGKDASIMCDGNDFEVGISAKTGNLPAAYGSGKTISDAVNEAIGKPIK
jgi:hypothetical protein